MIKRKGLAQIPLMIGLLIMAVAVPVATKLVQESQDTRNQAANPCGGLGAGCSTSLGGCCSGYVCTYGFCTKAPVPTCRSLGNPCDINNPCCSPYTCSGSYGGTCKSSVTATNTPKPTSTPTKKPTATPVPGACNSGNVGNCGTAGGCSSGKKCTYNPGGMGVPSSYSCVTSSSCNDPYSCNGPNGVSGLCRSPCLSSELDTGQSNCAYPGMRCCIPKPTATPTVINCGAGGSCSVQQKDFTKCKDGFGYKCNGTCWQKTGVCLTPPATSTPTTPPSGACSTYPMPNGCNCSNGSGCSSGYCSEAGKCENPPSPSNKCPGAEACPNPSNKNLLQNCTPPDSDGTPNDTLCNEAGMIRPCGGKNYCCPTAGGAWTTDMTKCPAGNCTQCPGKPEAKLKGDADCSGTTNLNDFSIWRDEFISSALGQTVKNSWKADFDCNGKVNLNDFSIWRDNFIKSL